jgi:hydrogenase maturation protease
VAEPASSILVLGLGNDILTDDAVGLHIVRTLRERLASDARVEVRETLEMGLALLDFFVGRRAVFLVDSIQTGKAPPGTLHELDAGALRQLTGRTPHFLGVGETLALGRRLELPMPERVEVFAVEVDDPFTLGTDLTPAVLGAVPGVVARLVDRLGAVLPGAEPVVS